MKKSNIAIFWYRRDLRLEDNAGLFYALQSGLPVLPLFIFDRHILDALEDRCDKRVAFIHQQVMHLSEQLRQMGSTLLVHYGKPEEVWQEILRTYEVKAVFANRDYEPYAKERDAKVAKLLAAANIPFYDYKDQCIFDRDEILKDDGTPYTVFTPYSRKWKKLLTNTHVAMYDTVSLFHHFLKTEPLPVPTLADMDFIPIQVAFPPKEVADQVLQQYGAKRDFPAIAGTSRLSVHLRFGTVSIRALARRGLALSEAWLNELIWRDFYMMILHHFPHVATSAFKPAYERICWRNNEQEFEAWCNGKTGYPIVDAGMRELNQTGFMHNRVRMITASFLTKHLLIDWRWGEAYFAKKLLDFDLAANNGGWQWAAGSGCDAAPYFRIFNPTLQTQKFDPNLQYVRQWVPEIGSPSYQPIVQHEFARQRAIKAYRAALNEDE
ncbi:MAG: deoxyribodipyrimidine photo-lyase [Cytophagales bacterium]|nr:DNA photolyase family protein [Bernardetiaceae bacterium]MDW8204135.1 deoxyribodipyrimidine photo-lyase [Cytophagales bacterium]